MHAGELMNPASASRAEQSARLSKRGVRASNEREGGAAACRSEGVRGDALWFENLLKGEKNLANTIIIQSIEEERANATEASSSGSEAPKTRRVT